MIANQVLSPDLPVGLTCLGTELFTSDQGEEYAFRGGVRLPYALFPEELYEVIDRTIQSRPKACAALTNLGLHDVHSRRRQFLKCNCSSFNRTPDYTSGLQFLTTEYVACSIRGTCQYEGKLCTGVQVEYGVLSIRELRVMSLIRKGYYDKEICEILFIALDTLKTHKKKIQQKLGLQRKSAIANAAAEMQII